MSKLGALFGLCSGVLCSTALIGYDLNSPVVCVIYHFPLPAYNFFSLQTSIIHGIIPIVQAETVAAVHNAAVEVGQQQIMEEGFMQWLGEQVGLRGVLSIPSAYSVATKSLLARGAMLVCVGVTLQVIKNGWHKLGEYLATQFTLTVVVRKKKKSIHPMPAHFLIAVRLQR